MSYYSNEDIKRHNAGPTKAEPTDVERMNMLSIIDRDIRTHAWMAGYDGASSYEKRYHTAEKEIYQSIRALIERSEKVDDLLAAIWACREAGTLPLGIGAAYASYRAGGKGEHEKTNEE